MSGVHGFVKGVVKPPQRQTSPPPTLPQQQSLRRPLDRVAAASGLKVSRGETHAIRQGLSPMRAGQPLASTAPAPGYQSNLNNLRNTYPNQAFHPQDTPISFQPNQNEPFSAENLDPLPANGGLFDDTCTSDLEDTKSDLQNGYEMEDGKGRFGNEDYDLQTQEGYHSQRTRQQLPVRHHRSKQSNQLGLQHKHSSPDLHQQQSAYINPSIRSAGRFEQPGNANWDAFAVGADAIGHQASTSSPGGENNLVNSGIRAKTKRQDMGQHRDYDSSESSGESDFHTKHDDHQIQESSEGLESRTDGVDSMPAALKRDELEQALDARQLVPNENLPDYDDETLQNMTYADLKKEPWDAKATSKPETQSSGQKRTNPTQTQDSAVSFEEGMERIVIDTAENQVQAFVDMPIGEFEQAGDFFVAKFGELMKQIIAARQKKRKIVAEFEEEIEAREKAVRSKSEILAQQFRDMRTGGEGVLRGKV